MNAGGGGSRSPGRQPEPWPLPPALETEPGGGAAEGIREPRRPITPAGTGAAALGAIPGRLPPTVTGIPVLPAAEKLGG